MPVQSDGQPDAMYEGPDSPDSPQRFSSFDANQPFPRLAAEDLQTAPPRVPDESHDDETLASPGYDDVEVEDDADFQSHYSLDNASSEDSSESEDDGDIAMRRPFLRSTSSLHGPNAFAPPFYNRPPTPLPPSPSLTSLLRPPFSTTTSRPTTPDSSDVETPNDTEAAVAKSARTATTVPRASPKVPTYEYYGFVLYLASSLAFCKLTVPAPGLRMGSTLTVSRSDLHPLVVSPVSLPPPAWNLLLSQPLVVPRHSVFPRHDYCVYLRCPGGVQYGLPDPPDEQYREHRGRGCEHCRH